MDSLSLTPRSAMTVAVCFKVLTRVLLVITVFCIVAVPQVTLGITAKEVKLAYDPHYRKAGSQQPAPYANLVSVPAVPVIMLLYRTRHFLPYRWLCTSKTVYLVL